MNRRDFIGSSAAAVGGGLLARPPAPDDASLERRRRFLETLRKILPPTTTDQLTGRFNALDKNWEDWVKRTGELPPDFVSMPSVADLPDPLASRQGARVTTKEQWRRRRDWIRSELEHWIYGKMPPAPDNLRAVVTETHKEGRITVREVRLEFGPGRRGILHVHLFIPEGDGPFPVFLTNQPRNSRWIHPAVRRGYLACTYDATDPRYGVTDDSDKFIDVYPDYDFACLARWAWAGMRAVDYLYTLPEVDKQRIGITGHSRNGKQALLAAAFDERIGAVAASSGTTGECLPWRYTSAPWGVIGTLEIITGGPWNTHWFHPRLRFFAGREHKLPVDQNSLMALVAPRGLLMCAAYAEADGNVVGYEHAYRSVQSVYRLLGRDQNVWLELRAGDHNPPPGYVERYVDFFETIFGRRAYPKSETWINGYTFEGRLAVAGEHIDPFRYPETTLGDFVPTRIDEWPHRRDTLRENLRWALGEEPAGLPFVPVKQVPASGEVYWIHPPHDNLLALQFDRPFRAPNMGAAVLPFGDGLRGDLYFPSGADGRPVAGRLPAVIWLHPYSYARGYSPYSGPPFDSPPFADLTRRGFAVLAFDQLGFGTRVLDARRFYEQCPKWSLMGKMIADTRAAVDAVSALDMIDPERLCFVGYSLGAKVGLLSAALDRRVNAIAAVCGIDPLRSDTPEKGAEGVRHYSHLHGLMPRLGFFVGKESRLPFDYDQVLAMIAPKPLLVVAPMLDRFAPVEDVRREVEAAQGVYRLLGQEDALRFETPLDFNRFPVKTREQVFDWITRTLALR